MDVSMNSNVRILSLPTIEDVKQEFEAIGVDSAGFDLMAGKSFTLSIKIKNLSPPAALILKQEMLSLGGDCANHRLVIKNSIEHSDSILIGNLKTFKRLIPKLRHQPFGLKKIADELSGLIKQKEEPISFVLKCGERTLDLTSRTHIMGILNVTPDSFSDGGKFFDKDQAIRQGIQLTGDGADIIDIGAESTRPGAEAVSEQEEIDRLMPVIEGLRNEIDVPISVDTYKSGVAEEALKNGADMINDISGLRFDPEMKNIVSRYDVPVVVMHIKGEPKNMQQNPYYDNLMDEIYQYLAESIELAMTAGVGKDKIIVDPGIGFGKRLIDNYEIIRRLGELSFLGCPILIGPSRKSFIGKILDLPPTERLEGTVAAVAMSIQNGAHIVRVHDVKEVRRACRIADLLAGKKASVEES